MSFLQRISKLFTSPSRPDDASLWITVKCNRCGEEIRTRIDLRNDLSIEYGEGSGSPTYITRKLLVGEGGRCFQRIEVELIFDANKNLVNQEIHGGEFIDEQPAR